MVSMNVKAILLRGPCFTALWWVLVEGRADGWGLGAIAVALATWTSWIMLPPADTRVSPAGVLRFLCFFVLNSLRGGVQVAAMAFRGRNVLRPACLVLPIMLPQARARLLLVNTLGLMPGTLGVDLMGDTLHLHVLDERLPILAEVRELEAIIESVFGGKR